MTKPKAKRVHVDEALPVWALDRQFDGLFEVYPGEHDRLRLYRDGWDIDDDEDTEDGLARLKKVAEEFVEEEQE